MTVYERRCRVLLKAFPEEYRSERGDEIVGVHLDSSTPGQRWPSPRTTGDLIRAGLCVRGRLGTRGRPSVALIEGMRMAALVGLLVQSAFSMAMVTHYARDGLLFYLTNNAWSRAAHGVVAATWLAGFVLVVAGRLRLALVPAVLASASGVVLLVSNLAGGTLAVGPPYDILIGVEMTLLGVVPTLALALASMRSARTPTRSMLWLVALALLTAVFSTLHTGVVASSGGGRQLLFPPSGSLMSFFFWLWVSALIGAALVSAFDPRVGIAILVVSLPLVFYQFGFLVAVETALSWKVVHVLPVVGIAALVAASSVVSLWRLRT